MAYFVTGATGFIGRHLVALLCARALPVWVLVRPGSTAKFEALARACGAAAQHLRPVSGDLQQPRLGVSAADLREMQGRISHMFHLGALYDLKAAAPDLESANVAGTRNALEFAHEAQAGCFHHVSSIAAAGRYRGAFTERMFAEATQLDHAYFRTKHESEGLVRSGCKIPWRIYRPGMVVGHSGTGVMDKVDGPYYLFKVIQRLRDCLPRWVPLIGFEGGHVNLVPVDFVAAALVHLAHAAGHDQRCFHLTDPVDRRAGEVLNLFARAAHAPTMALRLEAQAVPEAPPSAAHIVESFLEDLGIPRPVLGLLHHPTSFDAAEAQALLAPAGIRVPGLETYAWRLWDYWERHLDPGLHGEAALRAAVAGKVVLVTGGSSGIGRATALSLAAAGARLVIVARDESKLADVRAQIESKGDAVSTYRCDLADPADCDRFIARLLADHGGVDILINNAGRSIRRGIDETYDRFHDYERLMRINYFAAVRLTLGLLPAMVARRAGHVINISSIGVLTSAPRFAGYNASKAALEAFSRCAAAEYAERGIHFTVINMPLVRTPMVAPTKMYDHFDLMQPQEAADRVCAAIIDRPQRLATPLGSFAQLVDLVAPNLRQAVMSESYRSPDFGAFARLTRGIHW